MDGSEASIETEGGSFVPPTSNVDRAIRIYERQKGDHVERYRFASLLIGSGTVLDFGCGHGLGAFYLSRSDRSYTGIDSDARAVRWASECIVPRLPSAKFMMTTEFEQQGQARRFDAIVLLEVIEHVQQPGLLLERCLELLATGGRLVVSTPNGFLSEGSTRLHQSPYHIREFKPAELADLLSQSGFDADMYEQHRVDHIDSIPQLAKRALLGIPRRPSSLEVGYAGPQLDRVVGHTDARLTILYRIFQLAPEWRTLWRVGRLDSGRARPWSYSHILAVARPRGSAAEAAGKERGEPPRTAQAQLAA